LPRSRLHRRNGLLTTERFLPFDWLFGLEQFGIKFGLDNIHALVAELGHPERAFISVHVAGTNGKGSVVAMVDRALTAAGHRSGRYTSPHLVDLSERFVVDGQPVARPTLEAIATDVHDAVGRLLSRGQLQASPTFFEVTTAIAFETFRRARVEVAVCEVGLGGRLDATNVLRPAVTAITSIGFDHQQYLGNTLTDIAGEKAGIIKPGVPVVIGRLGPEARIAVEDVARRLGAPIIAADDRRALEPYAPLRLGLAGTHQLDNAVIAVRVLEELDRHGTDVPAAAIRAGLEEVVWPGRLEWRRLPDGREALLDAAHNPDGARALRDYLAASPPRPIVFAAMRDKDVRTIIEALAPVVSAFVMTRASNARSADPAVLADLARGADSHAAVAVEPVVGDALTHAWHLSPQIVVAGSIFLLGDVIKELQRP
jgi:dihydrofolate synthase/folylpolyglutamate synthase